MDLISIIVPCNNRGEYLPRCLDSLRRQTYENVEIVCVNDGSTDKTLTILQEYARKDSRIRVLDTPHGGPGRARNRGMEHASGKYLMFCDSDDEYVPEACEELYNAIIKDDSDLALCSIKVEYDTDKHMKSSDDDYYTLKFSGLVEDSHAIINSVDVSVCNKIFKKSLIDKYNIKFIEDRIYEDACFAWKYFTVAKKYYCVKKQLYIYYRHQGTIMNKTFAKSNHSIDHMYIADDIHEFLCRHGLFEDFIDDFFSFYKSCVLFSKKFADDENMDEIERLEAELQEKYLPWIKRIEEKENIKKRQKLFANLRSKVKL